MTIKSLHGVQYKLEVKSISKLRTEILLNFLFKRLLTYSFTVLCKIYTIYIYVTHFFSSIMKLSWLH